MDDLCFEPEGFICSIELSGLGQWVTGTSGSLWAYPLVLLIHGIGLMTVLGVVFAFNVRVLGFASNISLSSYDKLFKVAWIAFALNLLSGLILLVGDFGKFITQGSFIVKMALIILGGIMMKVVISSIKSQSGEAKTKLLAGLCLAIWFGAICAGRLMAYL
ncbi:MAG: hypothetical protein P8J61_03425 [Gammaproteobacteria bacterium]|jgi:hypothetical protein|nr:hypothetical protein [Gammaproteobacteria bacterium]